MAIINTDTLLTIRSWAKKQKVTTQATYQFFKEDNKQPAAVDVRAKWEMIIIDGIKFINKKQHNEKG